MTVGCADSQSIPKVPRAGETFAGPDGRYQLMHNGVKVVEDCYYGRWMTELIRLLQGHHEPQEERVFHEVLAYLPNHAAMVEAGSFWAYYSLWFQSRIAGARTYLLEPDPHNLEVGRRNFALNGAAGQFFQYSLGSASAAPAPFRCESDDQDRLVPQIAIDDFRALAGLDRIDLLFADIQGAELALLDGAARSIDEGAIRFVFLSTHHHSISGDPLTHQKCLAFLAEREAHILAAHNVTESYSGDGLIAASFAKEDRGIPPIPVSRNHPTNSLFRELEYDLAEAWQALAAARAELQGMTETCRRLGQQLAASGAGGGAAGPEGSAL